MRQKVRFRVRPSPIAGRGVFATRRIDKGEWIVEYAGERITEAEFLRRVPLRNNGDATHSVFFEIAPDVVIDANIRGNSARFINHSCDPNCEKRLENGRVQIYARREISAGEELSFDYAFAPEEHLSPETLAAHPCRCGSDQCRGTLFGSGT